MTNADIERGLKKLDEILNSRNHDDYSVQALYDLHHILTAMKSPEVALQPYGTIEDRITRQGIEMSCGLKKVEDRLARLERGHNGLCHASDSLEYGVPEPSSVSECKDCIAQDCDTQCPTPKPSVEKCDTADYTKLEDTIAQYIGMNFERCPRLHEIQNIIHICHFHLTGKPMFGTVQISRGVAERQVHAGVLLTCEMETELKLALSNINGKGE